MTSEPLRHSGGQCIAVVGFQIRARPVQQRLPAVLDGHDAVKWRSTNPARCWAGLALTCRVDGLLALRGQSGCGACRGGLLCHVAG